MSRASSFLYDNWDELHRELSYFSEKQPRQQASFVKLKGLVPDTNLETTNQSEEMDNSPADIVTATAATNPENLSFYTN